MKNPRNTYNRSSYSFRQKEWLPYFLVVKAIEEKWDDSLIVFLKLKQIYNRPIFYNFTKKGLAQLLGYSYNGFKPHFDRLIKEGLIYTHHGNLCLLGVNKLKQKYQSRFLVPVKHIDDKKDHLDCLRFVVIKRKLDLQKSHTDKLIEIIKMQENLGSFSIEDTKRIYKRYKKLEKDHLNSSIEKLIQCGPTLSNETIGSLINRSVQVGIKTQQNLNRLGLIKSFQRIEITDEKMSTSSFALKKLHSVQDDSLRGRNGVVFYQYSNIIFTLDNVEKDEKGNPDYERSIQNLFKRNDFFLLTHIHMSDKKNLIITRARTDKNKQTLSWGTKQSRLRSFVKESYLNSLNDDSAILFENDKKDYLSKFKAMPLKSNNLSRWQKAELTIWRKFNSDPSCSYYKNEQALAFIFMKRQSILENMRMRKEL